MLPGISGGADMHIRAGRLDNEASFILAGGSMTPEWRHTEQSGLAGGDHRKGNGLAACLRLTPQSVVY